MMRLDDIEARAKAAVFAYEQDDDRETVVVCAWLREALALLEMPLDERLSGKGDWYGRKAALLAAVGRRS